MLHKKMGDPSGNIYSVAYLPQRASPGSSGLLCLCLTSRCLQIHLPISEVLPFLESCQKMGFCPSIHTACHISIFLVMGKPKLALEACVYLHHPHHNSTWSPRWVWTQIPQIHKSESCLKFPWDRPGKLWLHSFLDKTTETRKQKLPCHQWISQ